MIGLPQPLADAMPLLFVLLSGILLVVLYTLPAALAYKRQHDDRRLILLVTLFLGWTGLGWVYALNWSYGIPTDEGIVLFEWPPLLSLETRYGTLSIGSGSLVAVGLILIFFWLAPHLVLYGLAVWLGWMLLRGLRD